MKKKIYEKPLMKDHKLHQNNYLLAANSKLSDGYVDGDLGDDDDEVDDSF